MYGEMRRELRRTTVSRNTKGCVRDCLDLQLPGAQHMTGILTELERRGDVVHEMRPAPRRHAGGPKMELVVRALV